LGSFKSVVVGRAAALPSSPLDSEDTDISSSAASWKPTWSLPRSFINATGRSGSGGEAAALADTFKRRRARVAVGLTTPAPLEEAGAGAEELGTDAVEDAFSAALAPPSCLVAMGFLPLAPSSVARSDLDGSRANLTD
jgi:hypothetical protein